MFLFYFRDDVCFAPLKLLPQVNKKHLLLDLKALPTPVVGVCRNLPGEGEREGHKLSKSN